MRLSNMKIEDRVKSVIASQLNISVENIKNNSFLSQELGADSLDTVEIIMAMEEEFGKTFPDDNIKIATVQDVINYISNSMQDISQVSEKG